MNVLEAIRIMMKFDHQVDVIQIGVGHFFETPDVKTPFFVPPKQMSFRFLLENMCEFPRIFGLRERSVV